MAKRTTKVLSLLTPQEETHLKGLPKAINGFHKVATDSLRLACENASKAGEYLIEAKKLVAHGEWQGWISTNCDCAGRTARMYMSIYRVVSELSAANRRKINMLPLRQLAIGVLVIAEAKSVRLAAEPAEAEQEDEPKDTAPKLTDAAKLAVADAPHRLRTQVAKRSVAIAEKRESASATMSDVKTATEDVLFETSVTRTSEELGISVEKLTAAGQAREQFVHVLRQLHNIRAAAMTLAASEFGAFIGTQQLKIDLTNAWHQIKYGRPYCPCVYCARASGMRQGCSRCHQLGWLSQAALKLAPEDLRQLAKPFKRKKS